MCEKFKKENSGGGESTERGEGDLSCFERGAADFKPSALTKIGGKSGICNPEDELQVRAPFRKYRVFADFQNAQTHSRKCRLASFLRKYLIQYPH